MWKPVLEGQIAEQATAAVRDVALAVASAPAQASDHQLISPADRTLFWAYATNLIDEPFAHEAYVASLDDVILSLKNGLPCASLYDGGLAGVGFTLAHVLDGGADDVLSVIDEALVDVLSIEQWEGSLDLAQGVVGLGVYFLERLQQNPNAELAAAGLSRVIHHLDRNAVHTDDGVTWLTTLAVMPESYRAKYPDGFHDCGVAHGQPGMIGFLARAQRHEADPRALRLLDGATQWLAAQRQPTGNGRFPAILPPTPEEFARFARLGTDPGTSPRRSRAAWCYGDLGVAAATWRACPEIARETALETSTRDASTCGVHDTGLCHGAVGLAHLCNRFYQATGDETHAEAARAWFARTLDMRRLEGVAGFASYRGPNADGIDSFVASHGFLEGAIGVALALAAAVSPSEPGWDRLLLCEVTS